MAHDPILRFAVPKIPEATDIHEASISWVVDGVPVGSGIVKRTTLGDSLGYTVKFSEHNPLVKLQDGNVVEAFLKSVDGTGKSPEPIVTTFPCPDSPPPNFINVTLKAI